MTPDQRKILEEMANAQCDCPNYGCVKKSQFRAGIQTAWDMATSQRVLSDDAHWSAGYRAGKEEATKAERERCAELLINSAEHWFKVSEHPAWGGKLTEDNMNPQEYASLLLRNMSEVILNPKEPT